MRRRPSSRLLILDPEGRVLLFRYVFNFGPLAGEDYWATPGGGVEVGESFAQAARRELMEETGIRVDDIGDNIARREFVMRLASGEEVKADERYFLLRVDGTVISRDGWTLEETVVTADHRWWTLDEIDRRTVTIWPEDLTTLLRDENIGKGPEA